MLMLYSLFVWWIKKFRIYRFKFIKFTIPLHLVEDNANLKLSSDEMKSSVILERQEKR